MEMNRGRIKIYHIVKVMILPFAFYILILQFVSLSTCNKLNDSGNINKNLFIKQTSLQGQALVGFQESNDQINNSGNITNIPNIGNTFSFLRRHGAWCNESSTLAKSKPEKRCKFPFQYENIIYNGSCAKLLEVDRKEKGRDTSNLMCFIARLRI